MELFQNSTSEIINKKLKLIFVSSLILILAVSLLPFAFADSPTKDFEQLPNGSYKLTKYLQPRIHNGFDYVPFIFTNTQDQLIIETEFGSVSLHKTGCNFSFYKTGKLNVPVYDDDGNLIGYDNSTPLFTDSIIAYQAKNGTDNWNAVTQVNNAECLASWNGKELTASRLASGVGKLEYKYILSGSSWKTQLEATNLTTLTDRKFGFTQTIELNRDTIFYGNSIRNLDNYHGQTFPRTWLENNEGKVLDFMNGINYDFDLAFKNLWSVSVYDTGVNKSTLAFGFYNEAPIVLPNETLILDPTFSGLEQTSRRVVTSVSTASTCPSASSVDTNKNALLTDSTVSGSCTLFALQFPLDEIPNTAEITNVTLSYEEIVGNCHDGMDITRITNDITVLDATSLWSAITTGFVYVNDNTDCLSVGSHVIPLGSQAISDLDSELTDSDQFNLGFLHTNMTRFSGANRNFGTDSTTSLVITYNMSPDPPKQVSGLQSLSEPFDLTITWASGENNGYSPTFDFMERLVGSSFVNICTVTSGTGTCDFTPSATGNEYFRVKQRNVLGDSCYQFVMPSSVVSNLQSHFPFCYTTNDNGLLDNDGTVTNSELYTTVSSELGFDFDGSSYITLPNESDYDFEHTDPFSIAAWINPNTGIISNDVVLAKIDDADLTPTGPGYSITWILSGPNRFLFQLVDSSNNAFQLATSANQAPLDTWTHLTVTYSGNSNLNGIKLYINGELDVTGGSSAISNTILNNLTLTIGAESNGGRIFDGQIKDFTVLDKELSQTEITQLYNEYIIISQASTIVTPQRPADDNPLIIWWTSIEDMGGFYFGLPFVPLGIMLFGALASGRTVPIFTLITLMLMGIVHASGFYVYPNWFWATSLILGLVLVLARIRN